MKGSRTGFAFLALLLVSVPVPGFAGSEITGSTEGGAFYKIVVPDHWNGDLVIWNHGFSLAPPAPVTDLGPLADLQLFEGYAVAASSYQQAGWALFKTKNDLQNLFGVFKGNFGTPNRVLLTGGSLGGLVTVAAIEEAHIGNVAGAFPFCGAVAGSRNWDAALDLRLVYDSVCSGVPGAAIPGGAEGLPPNASFTQTDLGLAVQECTGILAPPAFRTPGQTARMKKILDTLLIPENFLLTDMGYATFAMSDLVHDPGKLSGKIGTGNACVDYGDPAINASIGGCRPTRAPRTASGRITRPPETSEGRRSSPCTPTRTASWWWRTRGSTRWWCRRETSPRRSSSRRYLRTAGLPRPSWWPGGNRCEAGSTALPSRPRPAFRRPAWPCRRHSAVLAGSTRNTSSSTWTGGSAPGDGRGRRVRKEDSHS